MSYDYESPKESSSVSDPESSGAGSSGSSGLSEPYGSSSGSSSCDCEFDVTGVVLGSPETSGTFQILNLGTCTLTGIEVESLSGANYLLVLVVPAEVPPGGSAEVTVTADGDLRSTSFLVRTSCGEGVWDWPAA